MSVCWGVAHSTTPSCYRHYRQWPRLILWWKPFHQRHIGLPAFVLALNSDHKDRLPLNHQNLCVMSQPIAVDQIQDGSQLVSLYGDKTPYMSWQVNFTTCGAAVQWRQKNLSLIHMIILLLLIIISIIIMIDWVYQERNIGRRRVDNTVGCEDSWPRTIPPIIISTFDGDYRWWWWYMMMVIIMMMVMVIEKRVWAIGWVV